MNDKTIYPILPNGVGTSDYTLALSKIPRDRLEDYEPPKVVVENKFDLDMLCKQALTRLNYALEANVNYHLIQMLKIINVDKGYSYTEPIRHRTLADFPKKGVIGYYYKDLSTEKSYVFDNRKYVEVCHIPDIPDPFKSETRGSGWVNTHGFKVISLVTGSGGAGGAGSYGKNVEPCVFTPFIGENGILTQR